MNKYEVLIVDDIPENLQVLSNILYQEGVGISIATSGKDAIEVVNFKSFDLILLDISMPDMDGFEVCERLKENENTKLIPIIFLTARIQSKDIIRGFEIGGVDYVTKPFNHSELVARVFTHLELKHSRDVISRQNKKLKELMATRDKLFSIIAHDLKSPIATSVSFIKLLREGFGLFNEKKVKHYIELIYQSIKRGYGLLDTLLEWSKAQTGQFLFEPSNIKIKDIVDENIELVRNIAMNKGIAIGSDVEENIYAYADFKMISTVIRNLAYNAIKYSRKDDKIIISAKDVGEYVEVSVIDMGVGINKVNQKKLFRTDIFISTVGTDNEKGSGIGLNLCKEFVDKNNGKISLESTEGKGSTFKFSIPKPDKLD